MSVKRSETRVRVPPRFGGGWCERGARGPGAGGRGVVHRRGARRNSGRVCGARERRRQNEASGGRLAGEATGKRRWRLATGEGAWAAGRARRVCRPSTDVMLPCFSSSSTTGAVRGADAAGDLRRGIPR
ncbi:jg19779 [Pararge aegeria aegeria]|uniref:Jg19779 protein n=1 Tax=Pararge aegeria aegeria TaxID=348720 RepID=A0A8S4SE18_9NEOP|nr:jg19779 [Pararge aegeria aegeria]